ncbi:MAG: O-antigen ligase family protein [Geobacteraceae bacterium]|nr:O-antigen ligase family protein [Geobacteraceae bacterium]
MITPLFVVAILIITCFSVVDAMGLWLVVMILHGPLVDRLGPPAVHLPLQMGLCLAIVMLVRKKWQRIPFLIIALVMVTVMLMSLSALFGIDPEKSIQEIMNYGKGFLLIVMLVMVVRDERDLKKLTIYCLAGLTVGALMAVYQYKTGTFRINTEMIKRVATLRGDPNDTALLFVSGLPLAVYWLKASQRLVARFIAGGCFALLALGIVLTGSRGGFLALIFVLVLIYLRSPSVKTTMAGIVVVAALAVMAPGSYWERIGTIFTGREIHQSASMDNRRNLQQAGLKLAYENLALGVGPGNFGRAFFLSSNNARMGNFNENFSVVAHNMYLQFLVENGIFGIILFFVIIFRTFASLRKIDKAHCLYPVREGKFRIGYAIAVSLAGMLISGLLLSQAKNSVLWFMIGLGLAAEFVIRKAPSREELPIPDDQRHEAGV